MMGLSVLSLKSLGLIILNTRLPLQRTVEVSLELPSVENCWSTSDPMSGRLECAYRDLEKTRRRLMEQTSITVLMWWD
jgi:hypothetical protein